MKRFLSITLFIVLSAIAASAQCDTNAVTAAYETFLKDHRGDAAQKKRANDTANEYPAKFGNCIGDTEKRIATYIKAWQTKYQNDLVALSAIATNAQCDPDAIATVYQKFVDNHKGPAEQKQKANEYGKEYLAKFGDCTGEDEVKVTKFIKEWQAKYQAWLNESTCITAVDRTPAKAFELCRPYVARDPENLRAHLLLSLAGFKIAKTADKATKEEAVKAMRKSLDLISAGKSVDPWVFGGTKEEAIGTLEFFSASLTIDTDPAGAAAAMLRLAHSNSSYNKDPNTYFYLARSINNSEVKKQVAEYNEKCSGAIPPVECEAFNDKIDGVIDRVIDAYARAVALSNDKPEHASVTTAAKPELVELYKKRHGNSDAGLEKFVAEVLSRPIP
ncbi:MAG TPA: hypothetical protein VJV05_01695 [Pyrinomonadaceae bacterium]|nr:hypothetical protein [Pyrinomonadaceae bacterium]